MTRPELLAVVSEDEQPPVLARRDFYVPASSRGGTGGARAQAGGVFVHLPSVAVLLPSELPPLTQRRPDFASLRHVLARFSFMPSRLPLKSEYTLVTFMVTLDHPGAVVRLQRPAWEAPDDAESSDTVTTQLSAAVDSLAKLGAQRTTVRGTTQKVGQLPVVVAEKRDERDFGWRFEAHEHTPLVPRIEYMLALIELPRNVTELSGYLSAEAVVKVPRLGILQAMRAVPGDPPVQFRLPLGSAA